ncbi:MAG: hypothetical protein WC335_02315 [Candidatus Omnitrophota bacterium]|jgi:putative protease
MPTKKKTIKNKPAAKPGKKLVRKTTLKKSAFKLKKKTVSKRPVKKTAKKIAAVKKRPIKKLIHIGAGEKVVGKITHYFPKVRAGVIKLTNNLSVGDSIKIKGHTTDFTQKITSMQIDRTPLAIAKKGDEIGLLVDNRVRKKDIVIKL